METDSKETRYLIIDVMSAWEEKMGATWEDIGKTDFYREAREGISEEVT